MCNNNDAKFHFIEPSPIDKDRSPPSYRPTYLGVHLSGLNDLDLHGAKVIEANLVEVRDGLGRQGVHDEVLGDAQRCRVNLVSEVLHG